MIIPENTPLSYPNSRKPHVDATVINRLSDLPVTFASGLKAMIPLQGQPGVVELVENKIEAKVVSYASGPSLPAHIAE